ncbi:hypothetical protein T265_10859 [Opisthorchis viverrini]|uniref:Uncharacterized protein n=1 Tax=Opisthorchis viverrini TaxID=6198 RepID=A0A074Z0W6_OPIVI|nr:hypothetical protein T265_10859 [Opisthorchis viverrini]KER20651.1 hypothetical protein T265_10859 [Opisthorchis viverrini]
MTEHNVEAPLVIFQRLRQISENGFTKVIKSVILTRSQSPGTGLGTLSKPRPGICARLRRTCVTTS